MNLILCGAAGRMGQRIAALSKENPKITLAACVDKKTAQTVEGLICFTNLKDVISTGNVIIDFSHADASLENLKLAMSSKVPLVIGTTGFNLKERQQIEEAAKSIPIVFSSNMSIGVNVMWKLLEQATRALGPAYDIEVVEMHHRLKKDAPSGTAMTTAEVLAKAAGRNLEKDAVYSRHGMIGERKAGEIGIQTLRGGDVVGDHTVYFAGIGERLEITHRASSRDTFAQGALRAAEWVVDKKPGLYNMQDVLGLK
ncbi:MAG: 4-hydroxy-tetrahydrodipicolinate reductase [Deltaproteobacteria bacterium]|nr:4-hydroxy-tetrahydrodipicolinate reductase [Deltaproteobacteria bacterium]